MRRSRWPMSSDRSFLCRVRCDNASRLSKNVKQWLMYSASVGSVCLNVEFPVSRLPLHKSIVWSLSQIKNNNMSAIHHYHRGLTAHTRSTKTIFICSDISTWHSDRSQTLSHLINWGRQRKVRRELRALENRVFWYILIFFEVVFCKEICSSSTRLAV